MKLSAVTLLAIVCFSTLCSTEAQWEDEWVDPEPDKPCKVAYRCSTESDPVWASDGNLCLGFRNRCFLASENCERQNRYQPTLNEIDRSECQDTCPSSCPDVAYPVCGQYKNILRTFASPCEMDVYSCNSGTPFELSHSGPCS